MVTQQRHRPTLHLNTGTGRKGPALAVALRLVSLAVHHARHTTDQRRFKVRIR